MKTWKNCIEMQAESVSNYLEEMVVDSAGWIKDNFRGEFYPSGLFFHVFLPKNIHHFAFFEVLFRPILMG